MSPRSRRRQLFVLNVRWSVGLVLAVLAVVAGIVCIALGGKLTYVGLPLAAIGAVAAMIQTIARAKAGDDIDEAEL